MVIFYHELNSLSSGASVLITNIIHGLINNGHHILLINFKHGAIHKEFSNTDQTKLSVIENDEASIRKIARTLTSSDIIITTHFYTVFKFFKITNPRILFFCVNTTSLFEANHFFRLINFLKLTRLLIGEIKKRNGIIFGDEYALQQNAKLFSLNPAEYEIIPIPVVTPPENIMKQRKSEGKNDIGFTYIGRAVNWKIYPVKKLLKDLAKEPLNGRKVFLRIVTDDAAVFKANLPAFKNDNIRLEFYENLSQHGLNEFLLQNADLHFAMGTAALDGAKLGIPTILLDLAYNDFPENYMYNFVHHSKPAFIGTDANQVGTFTGMTMSTLLELANDRVAMKGLSEESYNYIKNYHDVSIISARLQKCIDDCKVHIGDIKRYLIRYWV